VFCYMSIILSLTVLPYLVVWLGVRGPKGPNWLPNVLVNTGKTWGVVGCGLWFGICFVVCSLLFALCVCLLFVFVCSLCLFDLCVCLLFVFVCSLCLFALCGLHFEFCTL